MQNISKLSLAVQTMPRGKLFEPKRWKSKEMTVLPFLEDLTIHQPRGSSANRRLLTFIEHMLPIAMLEKVYVEIPCALSISSRGLDLASLRELAVTCKTMHLDDFQALLKGCPNLRMLDFSTGVGVYGYPEDDPPLHMHSAVDTLQTHRNILTKMAIHFHHDGAYDEWVRPQDLLPSLHDFTSLRYLDVDFDCLLDISSIIEEYTTDAMSCYTYEKTHFLENLPHRLQNLRIFNADNRVIAELSALADRKGTILPHLANVTLEYFDETIGGIVKDDDGNKGYLCDGINEPLTKLKQRLAKVGVALVME